MILFIFLGGDESINTEHVMIAQVNVQFDIVHIKNCPLLPNILQIVTHSYYKTVTNL